MEKRFGQIAQQPIAVPDNLVFGSTESMLQIRERIERLSSWIVPVLVEGESGAGKRVLACSIHQQSPRRTAPILEIDCAAEEGAASFERLGIGLASTPAAGTILLRNIGELDVTAQELLLELIDRKLPQETGIICTSRAPLPPKVGAGTFNGDLYRRISALRLSVPPLRQRRVDIPLLAFHFLKLYAELYQRSALPFGTRVMEAFMLADWPGNIRELENAVKRYTLLDSESQIIESIHLDPSSYSNHAPGGLPLRALKRIAVRDCECKAILVSLNRNHWNRRNTARELQISYRSLLNLMKELGLPAKRRLQVASTQS